MFPGIVLLVYLVICSIYDIKDRRIPIPLIYLGYLLALIGLIQSVISKDTQTLVLVSCAVGVFLILTFINAQLLKRDKDLIVGGADNLILLVICVLFPMIWIIPSLIIIPALSFILATLIRLIPKVNESFTNNGIPYIPFMSAIWIISYIG